MKKIAPLLLLVSYSAWSTCPDGKTYPVHFTFDDGPHTTYTPKVLDILKAEKVPSTFFVLGEHFSGGKGNASNKTKYEILDRMKKEGHLIGSHTYSHLNHPKFSQAEIKTNITKPNALLKGYLSSVLRLPYGAGHFRSSNAEVQKKNDYIMKTVKEAGFEHLAWDIDTNDWDPKKRPTLLKTLLNDICKHKGGVVLFHDIQKNTVDNLQSWIKAIKAEGHTFAGLEKFRPAAAKPLGAEYCELDAAPSKQVKSISTDVEDIVKKVIKE